MDQLTESNRLKSFFSKRFFQQWTRLPFSIKIYTLQQFWVYWVQQLVIYAIDDGEGAFPTAKTAVVMSCILTFFPSSWLYSNIDSCWCCSRALHKTLHRYVTMHIRWFLPVCLSASAHARIIGIISARK